MVATVKAWLRPDSLVFLANKINVEKFREFALDTARELTTMYSWYYIATSVHKILIHAPEIIQRALVSIGELSEEAAKARNKDVRKYRLNHATRILRVATNKDLINRLRLSSDATKLAM